MKKNVQNNWFICLFILFNGLSFTMENIQGQGNLLQCYNPIDLPKRMAKVKDKEIIQNIKCQINQKIQPTIQTVKLTKEQLNFNAARKIIPNFSNAQWNMVSKHRVFKLYDFTKNTINDLLQLIIITKPFYSQSLYLIFEYMCTLKLPKNQQVITMHEKSKKQPIKPIEYVGKRFQQKQVDKNYEQSIKNLVIFNESEDINNFNLHSHIESQDRNKEYQYTTKESEELFKNLVIFDSEQNIDKLELESNEGSLYDNPVILKENFHLVHVKKKVIEFPSESQEKVSSFVSSSESGIINTKVKKS